MARKHFYVLSLLTVFIILDFPAPNDSEQGKPQQQGSNQNPTVLLTSLEQALPAHSQKAQIAYTLQYNEEYE